MALMPKRHSTDGCYANIGRDGFVDTTIDNLKDTFEINPDYKPVYIVHDASQHQDFLHEIDNSVTFGLQKYDAWVFDGTEENQIVGHKYIQMYPYGRPVLQQGDYVAFDYHDDNKRNIWLCVALDSSTLYQQMGKIRRCTNEVRFYNSDGELIRVPCVFDDKINSEKDVALTNLKYINGITTIYMQYNPDSIQLKPNQRLLFGRQGAWTAFKVVSVGVNNFMNEVYWDNETSRILEITMEASYVNEDADDLVNGVADVTVYNPDVPPVDIPTDEYAVVVSPYAEDGYSILQGDEVEFSCKLYKNGVADTATFTFVVDEDKTDIPTECYKFSVVDGNAFKVKNIRRTNGSVVISCVSGEHSFDAVIKLKGAW